LFPLNPLLEAIEVEPVGMPTLGFDEEMYDEEEQGRRTRSSCRIAEWQRARYTLAQSEVRHADCPLYPIRAITSDARARSIAA
jgi:hypothetical protein